MCWNGNAWVLSRQDNLFRFLGLFSIFWLFTRYVEQCLKFKSVGETDQEKVVMNLNKKRLDCLPKNALLSSYWTRFFGKYILRCSTKMWWCWISPIERRYAMSPPGCPGRWSTLIEPKRSAIENCLSSNWKCYVYVCTEQHVESTFVENCYWIGILQFWVVNIRITHKHIIHLYHSIS